MDDQETFVCGCRLDPHSIRDYCNEHHFWTCHTVPKRINETYCPPCRRAKLLSVNLSRKAVPTRRGE